MSVLREAMREAMRELKIMRYAVEQVRTRADRLLTRIEVGMKADAEKEAWLDEKLTEAGLLEEKEAVTLEEWAKREGLEVFDELVDDYLSVAGLRKGELTYLAACGNDAADARRWLMVKLRGKAVFKVWEPGAGFRMLGVPQFREVEG